MTDIRILSMKGALRGVQYDGHNAQDIAEYTGGKFEAAGGSLYLQKTEGIYTEIDPGTWIIHVPWSPVPYQYVSDAAVQHFFNADDSAVAKVEP